MADVFVSYKAEDRRRVKPLVEALAADGFSVWWDTQIGGGEEWRQAIEEHLEAARCVIVVWSRRSTGREGRFVRDEAMHAQRRGTYLPVKIDKVEPPLGFGEMQALALVRWKGDRSDPRYQAVLSAVRSVLAGKPYAHHRNSDVSGIGRRTLLAGAGAVATAVVAVGGWTLMRRGSGAPAGSVAVLPFANLSGDPAQAYFSDGIAEELRSALSRIPQLKVIGRTSSEAVRNEDAKAAARKLGVATIVTGSVRRSTDTLRVSAQLVDGTNGIERWSQDYDRSPGDVLKIQTDIAQSIAQALSIVLAPTELRSLTIGGTSKADAQDLYMQARAVALSDDSEAGLRRAISLLDQALGIDPNYAKAHAERAHLLGLSASTYATSPADARQGFALAASDAQRAIEIAPRLASGYVILARALLAQLNFTESLRQIQRATGLANDADTLSLLAVTLSLFGQNQSALSSADHAIALDPLNPRAYSGKAQVLLDARRFLECAAAARQGLSIAPTKAGLHLMLGDCLSLGGHPREALAEYAQAPQDDPFRLIGESIAFARIGDQRASDRALAKLKSAHGVVAAYQIAGVYAQRGEKDQAFMELNSAVLSQSPNLEQLPTDPFLDPLRTDPRFRALLAKLNFPRAA